MDVSAQVTLPRLLKSQWTIPNRLLYPNGQWKLRIHHTFDQDKNGKKSFPTKPFLSLSLDRGLRLLPGGFSWETTDAVSVCIPKQKSMKPKSFVLGSEKFSQCKKKTHTDFLGHEKCMWCTHWILHLHLEFTWIYYFTAWFFFAFWPLKLVKGNRDKSAKKQTWKQTWKNYLP